MTPNQRKQQSPFFVFSCYFSRWTNVAELRTTTTLWHIQPAALIPAAGFLWRRVGGCWWGPRSHFPCCHCGNNGAGSADTKTGADLVKGRSFAACGRPGRSRPHERASASAPPVVKALTPPTPPPELIPAMAPPLPALHLLISVMCAADL